MALFIVSSICAKRAVRARARITVTTLKLLDAVTRNVNHNHRAVIASPALFLFAGRGNPGLLICFMVWKAGVETLFIRVHKCINNQLFIS